MHKASAVMYSIANIFNWIILILAAAGIVLSILGGLNIIDYNGLNWGTLAYFIVVFIASIIIISLVRKAKAKGILHGQECRRTFLRHHSRRGTPPDRRIRPGGRGRR